MGDGGEGEEAVEVGASQHVSARHNTCIKSYPRMITDKKDTNTVSAANHYTALVQMK